jgi:hypothetical protein
LGRSTGFSLTGAAGKPSGNLMYPDRRGRFISWSGSRSGSMCLRG